jgi:hypothetical protein
VFDLRLISRTLKRTLPAPNESLLSDRTIANTSMSAISKLYQVDLQVCGFAKTGAFITP